jgi:SAM-dependent methyltransferase
MSKTLTGPGVDGVERLYQTKLNLGCGDDYRDGWHNVDVRAGVDPDEQVDLNDTPWPWPDGSFEFVLMDNVIEHLDDRLAALQELHRITQAWGTVVLRFPHWNSPGHYTCPSHTNTLTHRTFDNREVADLFSVRDVSARRVRAGRLLPEPAALWLADHIGHLVSGVKVTLEVEK